MQKKKGKKEYQQIKNISWQIISYLKKNKLGLVITVRIHDIASIFLYQMLHENIVCPNS